MGAVDLPLPRRDAAGGVLLLDLLDLARDRGGATDLLRGGGVRPLELLQARDLLRSGVLARGAWDLLRDEFPYRDRLLTGDFLSGDLVRERYPLETCDLRRGDLDRLEPRDTQRDGVLLLDLDVLTDRLLQGGELARDLRVGVLLLDLRDTRDLLRDLLDPRDLRGVLLLDLRGA